MKIEDILRSHPVSIPLSEADTRAKLIDRIMYRRGWTEECIKREETLGAIDIINGKGHRRSSGRADYVLRIKVNPQTQPVALAVIEAKKNTDPPAHGLSQAKAYAACKRMNVPFVFASNGYQFVMFDRSSGLTAPPRSMADFPTPAELRARYEEIMGFNLEHPAAKPLLIPYPGGEATRRYYQDAAIRAVLEKLARCEIEGRPKRALLSLATGAGKTFIAVNLLKRIADAGQLQRALFVCDRDELRTQGLKNFQNVFGSDAAEVRRRPDGSNHAKNARIHIATYQTLGVDNEEGSGSLSFLSEHYPDNYFTHIMIDECHRSAWGKWSHVLTRNSQAAQIGLTATPRQLTNSSVTTDGRADEEITANNFAYFGEPVYEYDLAQAIEDGYLAACEIRRGAVDMDEPGLTIDEIMSRHPVDATTGEPLSREEVEEYYSKHDYERRILLPDRIQAMCADLFAHLLNTGGPEQKTIIFCVRDWHAQEVADTMNNLYAHWCAQQGKERLEPYAFKCTAAASGNEQLPDLRAASRSHFIAATVELLTTGVDVPCVQNIVFFKYLRSPISFYQMVGRGTRIDIVNGKLMFRVYDYTDATQLFGEEFVTRPPQSARGEVLETPGAYAPVLRVEGFEVHITDAGHLIVAERDGKAMPIPVEEYRERLAARLVAQVRSLEDFRACWIDPPCRRELLDLLVGAGYSPSVLRMVDDKTDYDLYDVLAEAGWGLNPRTRQDRALAFRYKHEEWLYSLPQSAGATILAIADQFALGGTEELENPQVFRIPAVKAAGGLEALKLTGTPAELLRETKARMFAA